MSNRRVFKLCRRLLENSLKAKENFFSLHSFTWCFHLGVLGTFQVHLVYEKSYSRSVSLLALLTKNVGY